MPRIRNWAVVLAGGEGRRLQSLARLISGDDRPKQFCRVFGDKSLLQDTLARVAMNVEPRSTLCVVLRDHEVYYEPDLREFDRMQVVAQPRSCGTAAAVAYALHRSEAIAPGPAVVGFFPADHYYANSLTLQRTVADAYRAAARHPTRVFLIGAEANAPEVDFGWIEAGPPLTSSGRAKAPLETARAVSRFWEKPSMEDARELLTRGCLWNTFIVIGHRAAFGRMLARTQPTFWAQFEGLDRPEAPAQEAALAEAIYERIEPIDLSADVLQQAPEDLGVIPLADAGWTDLGRPARVLKLLDDINQPHPRLRRLAS